MRTKRQLPTAEQIFNAYFSKLTVSQRHEAVDFMGANLSGADLSGAELYMTDLRWANLSKANFTGANLIQIDLRGANLSRAVLIGANLSEAKLDGANLSKAIFQGAIRAAFSQAIALTPCSKYICTKKRARKSKRDRRLITPYPLSLIPYPSSAAKLNKS